MAAMAGRGKGGNELELRGVGFGDEVGQVVGGARRRSFSPDHLAGGGAMQQHAQRCRWRR